MMSPWLFNIFMNGYKEQKRTVVECETFDGNAVSR